ncbi:MAG: glycosyltransferase family 4 protein [Kiritimatiellae bacterium]|nr:glycosyltransferase family 4 protein [Kiritimatiellia bacterium]
MKKRIAFLVQGARGGLYGAEKATVQLAGALAARGHAVRIWRLRETRGAGEGSDPMGAAIREAGIDLRDIDIAGRASPAAAKRIGEEVEAWGADVLHTTGYKSDVHGWWASAKGTRPFALVAIVHGWLFRGDWREWLYYRADLATLRRFDRVVVLSAFYERLLRRKGFDPRQLARIPTGIASFPDDEDCRALWTHGGPFTFGVLGRLSEEKNPFLVLQAAKRLVKIRRRDPSGWRIVFAGDGPLRKALERKAERMGLAGKVAFEGVTDSGRFFRSVHVLVQTSNVENRPMSLLEAAAWGRSAIVTKAGGMPEIVADGYAGRVVAKGDAKALAEAMDGYLTEPAKARMDGTWARRHALAEWSFADTLSAFEGLYATLPRR